MVSFLDEEPQASIRELTQTCKESTRLEMEQCQMDMANCNLDYKMARLDKLAMIHVKYPYMTDAQIIKHFPELQDFMDVSTCNMNMAGI